MEINRPQLKAAARGSLKESKTNPYILTLIYVIISTVLSYLNASIYKTNEILDAIESGAILTAHDLMYYAASGFEYILGIMLNFMSLMLSVGFIIFALKVWRRQENSIGNLFDGFAILLRIIGLEIVMSIFIFLWSLLLFIPGLIASLSYSRAIYLLIDHPEMSIMDCIRESKRLMNGRKGEYFILMLSFFGWMLLASVPMSVSPLLGIMSAAISIYITPYMQVTYAGWHDMVVQQDRQRSMNDGTPPYTNGNEW